MSLGVEGLRMASSALWTHKLRSALTILGVVIGVASVLTVTSLGAAFEDSLLANFDALDDRSIFVTATVSDVSQGPPDAGQFGLIFTEVDRQNLEDIEGVERVIASGEVSVTRLASGDKELPFRTLVATTPDAEEVRDLEAYSSGGPFELGENEIVVGEGIARQLGGLVVGDPITLSYEDGSEDTATLVGILAAEENLFFANTLQVFVPVDPFYDIQVTSPTTGEKVRVYDGFTVIADDPRTVEETQERVEEYMTTVSDAEASRQEDLTILVATTSDITSGISSAFDQATLFIAGIAGVSLLVGGVMIGTIMLISVTERTKEIGMMKAIGALDRQILTAFLIEAALVGLIGAIIGILIGLAGGAGLVTALFDSDEVGFVVPWDWVGYAVLVGVGTGVVAGFFPARRATKIEPVEALSYE